MMGWIKKQWKRRGKRMRRWRLTLFGVLLLLFIGGGIVWFRWNQAPPGEEASFWKESWTVQPSLEGVNNAYRAKITVNPEEKVIQGDLTAWILNDTGKEQDHVYFHIYPNLFRPENSLRGSVWEEVLGKDPKPGWMKVEGVWVQGKKVDFIVKDTLLEIPLDWKKGEKTAVMIRFSFGLPQNNGRLSYDDHAMWLGNWLPIKAVYDEEGWNLDPYYPIGDPFYSDIANYEVEVRLPQGFQVASTGVEVGTPKIEQGNMEIHHYRADKVRDFAMVVMDKEYTYKEGKAGDVRVLTWHKREDSAEVAERLHQVAISSLTAYSQKYGGYPYPEYDVVATGGFFGGMEYPGLIFAEGSYFRRNDPYGVLVVAHETAHQWWYGLVGNDEVEHPWMDESLTEYATLNYLLEHEKSWAPSYLRLKESAIEKAKVYESRGERISASVNQFTSWDSYGVMIYEVGPLMFYEWEQKVGKEEMEKMLKDYFSRYRYKNATPEDFLQVVKDHFGDRGVRFMKDWLEGKEH